jgi:hypothetical protein
MKSGKTEPYGTITKVVLPLYIFFNEEMSNLHHRTEECCRGSHSKLHGLLDANITRTTMSTELNQSASNSLQHRVSFLLRP